MCPTVLHVLSVCVPGERPALVAPRLAIEAGEASEISLVESHVTLGGGVALVTAVTDVTLGAGAVIDHVKIQRESNAVFHLASTFVTLARASTFTVAGDHVRRPDRAERHRRGAGRRRGGVRR